MKKKRKIQRGRIIASTVVTILLSIVYYFIFSWLFDTPIEHELKKSTEKLQDHINELHARCDTLELVLRNLQQRDSAVFGIIFESTPYVADNKMIRKDGYYEDEDISTLCDIFLTNIQQLEQRITRQNSVIDTILTQFAMDPQEINRIPSIQPVNNPGLRLLATSFGTRINPFYKSRSQHNGFDYTVPVGTSVFATADGVVSRVEKSGATTGTTVTINHENGYQTYYSFLSRTSVRVGNRVRRGDIIAFTGENGLSYAPHLHYEIHKNGSPVNPIDYMFLEIGPDKLEEFREISSHAMQAFD